MNKDHKQINAKKKAECDVEEGGHFVGSNPSCWLRFTEEKYWSKF